jgi:hypothetical protein
MNRINLFLARVYLRKPVVSFSFFSLCSRWLKFLHSFSCFFVFFRGSFFGNFCGFRRLLFSRLRAAEIFRWKCFCLQKITLVSDNSGGAIAFLDYLQENVLNFRFTDDSPASFNPNETSVFFNRKTVN